MHFISLVAVEMPKITEDQAKNQEIEKCLEELQEAYKQDSKNIILANRETVGTYHRVCPCP